MVKKIREKINGNGKIIYRISVIVFTVLIGAMATWIGIGANAFFNRYDKDMDNALKERKELHEKIDSISNKVNTIDKKIGIIERTVTDHEKWGINEGARIEKRMDQLDTRIRTIERGY